MMGFINPVLGYLSELSKQGFHIDCYGSKTTFGRQFAPIATNIFDFPDLDMNKTEKNSLQAQIMRACLKGIPQIEALWENSQSKPKLIIADQFALYAGILARKHKIPIIAFCSSFIDFSNPKRSLDIKTKEMLEKPFAEHLQLQIQEIKEKYGIELTKFEQVLVKGDIQISCLPEFWGTHFFPLKKNEYYIGPGFRDESADLYSDFDIRNIKDRGDKLIYLSLGTTPSDSKGFYVIDNIIEALKTKENTTLLIAASMGKAEELKSKGPLPKNVLVYEFVPQYRVLEYASLFITHMGANGTLEAIANGVPIIGIPQGAEQYLNAQIAEELNIGKWLKSTTVRDISETIAAVLESQEIQANIKKYQAAIDPQQSRKKFVELVKSIMI